jgi:methionyl-tRNA synthetase
MVINLNIDKNKKYIVTSALPYVNSVPHLGNSVCIVSADVFNRFLKKEGLKSRFICATDEHGTRTELEAKKRGVSPYEYCESMNKLFLDLFLALNVEFDYFGRTSCKSNHEITQSIFLDLYKKGFVIEKNLSLLYCEHDEMYLADSYVEGTCPHCGYEQAKGDQCDGCSKFLEPVELIHPKCKICGSVPCVKVDKHIFIDLKKLQPKVKKWIMGNKNLRDDIKNLSLGWIKEGLKPRCISRNLKYGVKVPLKGYEDKVFYVWFDAPIGYIGVFADKYPDWKEWWQSEDTYHYEFMGKDNVPFHSIFFPAVLLGSNENGNKWNLPYSIGSNQYLTYEGRKFSKSNKVGLFLDDVSKLNIKPDVIRYYIISARSIYKDTEFSFDSLMDKNNKELVANLGNLVYRTLTFTDKNFSCVPDSKVDSKLIDDVNSCLSKADKYYMELDFKEALRCIMDASSIANQFFQHNSPWELIKTDKDKTAFVLRSCIEVIHLISKSLWPIMPATCESIQKQLGFSKFEFDSKFSSLQKLGSIKLLFKKIEDGALDKFKAKFSGQMSPKEIFDSMDLRVAKVVSVNNHPGADKLYVIELDVGAYKRTVVSGLRDYFKPEDLVSRNVILFSNLKKAKIRGVESEGMILAATLGKDLTLLDCDSKVGSRVIVGSSLTPAKSVDYSDFAKLEILVDSKNNVVFLGKNLKSSDGKLVLAKGIKEGAKVC